MTKKIIIALTVICLGAAAAFAACSALGGNDNALSANDAYGMGAVSAVRILGSEMGGKAVKTLSAVTKNAAETATTEAAADASSEAEVKAQAEKFNEYFAALDGFLGEDVVSTTTQPNTDPAYPYDTKMTVKGRDFDGNPVEYIMYYTETLVRTEYDDGEEEKIFSLTGVMKVDGEDYTLEGSRTEETERDESENELKIRAYASADRTTYVEMEQEYSEEDGEKETEYVYTVYKDGRQVEQTAVEFGTEREHGGVETEYEIEFRSGTGRGRYEVERFVKNGQTEMTVKYDINGKRGQFVIREITAADGTKQYEYTFADSTKRVF